MPQATQAAKIETPLARIEIQQVRKKKWPPEYSEHAQSQGWDLFNAGAFQEIERIDVPEDGSDPVFTSDDDAIRFVFEQYMQGCPVAARAMSLSVFRTADMGSL